MFAGKERAPRTLETEGPAVDDVQCEARLPVMGHAQFRAVKAEATDRAA